MNSKTKYTKAKYYTVFPSAWGAMGAVASEKGLIRVVLPHYTPEDLEALLAWEHKKAARNDEIFADFIAQVKNYFNRTSPDFSKIALDLPGEGTFFGKVYRACMEIPFGQTLSYRELATKVGNPDAARATATAMSQNPTPLIVPCHRVIYTNGKPGGFSAEGGEAMKLKMLAHEKN